MTSTNVVRQFAVQYGRTLTLFQTALTACQYWRVCFGSVLLVQTRGRWERV